MDQLPLQGIMSAPDPIYTYFRDNSPFREIERLRALLLRMEHALAHVREANTAEGVRVAIENAYWSQREAHRNWDRAERERDQVQAELNEARNTLHELKQIITTLKANIKLLEEENSLLSSKVRAQYPSYDYEPAHRRRSTTPYSWMPQSSCRTTIGTPASPTTPSIHRAGMASPTMSSAPVWVFTSARLPPRPNTSGKLA